jgi:hypothetical protein
MSQLDPEIFKRLKENNKTKDEIKADIVFGVSEEYK